MSSPTTDIEIMSDACMLVGKKQLTTIDPTDEFAVQLQAMYDLIVGAEISSNMWKFCKKHQQLSHVAGFDPDFAQWTDAFDLPADFKSMIRVYPAVNYQIFGLRLYAMTDGRLDAEYNAIVPVTYWSDKFKEYIVTKLASKLAANVENPKLIVDLKQELRALRAEAMWVDSQNAPNVPFQSMPWIEARLGGYYSRGR